jgi:AraC-like DNA-binding protein
VRKYLTLADPVVPMHHPRVLVETAVAQGACREDLLAGVGIVPDTLQSPDARISYAQFGVLTGNALRLTANPALGLDVGSRIHVAHLGVLGLAVMSSPNCREAWEIGLRYYRAIAPAWDMTLHVEQGEAVLTVRESLPFGPYRVFAVESLLAALWSQCSFMLGAADMPQCRVCLPYPRPPHADRYAAIGAGSARFDQDRFEVRWDASVLDRRLSFADPVTATLAERHCAAELTEAAENQGLIGQVRRLLGADPKAYADLDVLAKTLQTSSRSLRRGLQQMGTSYQKLLDEVRREQAIHYVAATLLTTDQVAQRLGFGDVRSFRRAFKRWTGVTPHGYRAHVRTALGDLAR